MGFFGKLTQGVIDIATIPIDIVKDVATLEGVLTDENESYTIRKVKKLKDKAEKIYDSLDD